MTDTNSERCDVAVTVPDAVTTGKRINHRHPEELLLRGHRGQIGGMLMDALAQLTGDEIIAALTVDDLLLALHTLGEIGTAGYIDQINADDLLTTRQVHVCSTVADLWAERYLGCGWCGRNDHDNDECPSRPATEGEH